MSDPVDSSAGVHVELAVPLVAVVTLDRPPVNALGAEIRETLLQTFDSLQERGDVAAIVLTAHGKVFCAGADLKEKATLGQRPGDRTRADRLTRELFFAILDSGKPVIAAVNGAAMGAGFVLASCCDMIVAANTALFAMPEIDVGQGGGASFLRRILPASKVRRLVLTGERIPAAELYRLGAIEECVEPARLMETAVGIASVIASKSPVAVRSIRGSFSAVEELGLREGFRLEQNYSKDLTRSADAKEARSAFLEKRKPHFSQPE